jgi:hypothetical protein
MFSFSFEIHTINMSDKEVIENVEEAETEIYQPPPQKTIEEIVNQDQEDESLRKYKEALLGAAQVEKIIVGKFYVVSNILKKCTIHNCFQMQMMNVK